MKPDAQALNDLRDIHEPAQVGLWPPAAGWWLLMFVLVLAVVGAAAYLRRRRPRRRREALGQLRQLKTDYRRDQNVTMLVSGLSMLVRRITLSLYARPRVAGLAGEAWLEFLDETGQTTAFTSGVGRVLITAPYKPRETVDPEALVSVVESWIKKVT